MDTSARGDLLGALLGYEWPVEITIRNATLRRALNGLSRQEIDVVNGAPMVSKASLSVQYPANELHFPVIGVWAAVLRWVSIYPHGIADEILSIGFNAHHMAANARPTTMQVKPGFLMVDEQLVVHAVGNSSCTKAGKFVT